MTPLIVNAALAGADRKANPVNRTIRDLTGFTECIEVPAINTPEGWKVAKIFQFCCSGKLRKREFVPPVTANPA
jgi:hypothetical protein